MLRSREIKEHYRRPEIKETIQRVSTFGPYSRAGCGDRYGWYKPIKGGKSKYNIADDKDYKRITGHNRTLYTTLNIFDQSIYELNYNIDVSDSPHESRMHTVGYTFGIDIDVEHDQDIHDPEVKKSVEAVAQYYVDYLKRVGMCDYINVLYSVGGIYVLLHHEALTQYFTEYSKRDDWETLLMVLLDALNILVTDVSGNFFIEHPECVGKIKVDALNGSQRIFKTIFSVHKSLDYAVIPLDPDNIEINFGDATIPIKSEIIERAKTWYTLPEGLDCRLESGYFLKYCLHERLEAAYNNNEYQKGDGYNIAPSSVPIEDINQWPPCMRNIYNLQSCGEGKTRALGAFASFLHQVGIPRDTAKSMFLSLVNRWGADKSNIFESYYDTKPGSKPMEVPSCKKLNSDDNRGFPRGVSIKILGVCKPDIRCLKSPSPRYYADKVANVQRMKINMKRQSVNTEKS